MKQHDRQRSSSWARWGAPRASFLLTLCLAPAAIAQSAAVPGASFVHAPSEGPQPDDAPADPPGAGSEGSAPEVPAAREHEVATPASTTSPPPPSDGANPGKQATPLVAVLDLRASEGEEALAAALATVVTAELAARDDVRAVSRSEIQALMAHKAEQALLGCESVKCAADLGKLIEADLVVTGAIERAGEAYVFSLSLIDPVVSDIKERVELSWRGPPEEIVVVVRPSIDRLLAGPKAASFTGALDVIAPEGASIFLGGQDVGSAPLAGPLTGLPIGVHTLEVAKSGHVTLRREVVIARGETTIARVELEEEPLVTQWWFWTAVGGGTAVALAAGATIGTVALLSALEPPATSLSVKANLPTVRP